MEGLGKSITWLLLAMLNILLWSVGGSLGDSVVPTVSTTTPGGKNITRHRNVVFIEKLCESAFIWHHINKTHEMWSCDDN